MNERIQELLAELDIDLYTDEGEMMTKILVRPKDLRQFAELIVKECAKVILETPVDYMETDTMHRIRDSVKQHFGVEE